MALFPKSVAGAPSGPLSGRLRALWNALPGQVFGQRRRLATVAAAVLAAGIGYHVVLGHNGVIAFRQKRVDAHSLELQVKTLQHENEALRDHVDRLQADPNSIEHQAREELHYTRPGEVIVTLPPDAPAPTKVN